MYGGKPMKPLRRESNRPGLLVDPHAQRTGDPSALTDRVGRPAPFGRERVLFALPLGKEQPPLAVAAELAVHDHDGAYVAAADGALIGRPGGWIARLLYARWTEDTRRLAG